MYVLSVYPEHAIAFADDLEADLAVNVITNLNPPEEVHTHKKNIIFFKIFYPLFDCRKRQNRPISIKTVIIEHGIDNKRE